VRFGRRGLRLRLRGLGRRHVGDRCGTDDVGVVAVVALLRDDRLRLVHEVFGGRAVLLRRAGGGLVLALAHRGQGGGDDQSARRGDDRRATTDDAVVGAQGVGEFCERGL